jgi:hypothetical protein
MKMFFIICCLEQQKQFDIRESNFKTTEFICDCEDL